MHALNDYPGLFFLYSRGVRVCRTREACFFPRGGGSALALLTFLLAIRTCASEKRSLVSYQAFAFLELKTMELATAVLELDGIVFKETQLKMRRPSDFNPSLVPAR